MLKKLNKSRNVRTLKRVFALACLTFFSYHAYNSGELLSQLMSSIEWQWFVLVLLILMLQTTIGGLFTFTLTTPFSDALKLSEVIQIHISRLPAKYLPGGIWHVASKLSDLRCKGLEVQGLAKIALFETIIPIVVTFLLGGIVVSALTENYGIWRAVAAFSASAAFLFVIGYGWLARIRCACKFLIPKQNFYLSFTVVVIYWAIAGLGFCFYLISLLGLLDASRFFEVWGVYLLSWGVGNVAVFSPQGVGVLEWAVSSMLPLGGSLGSMMVVVGGYRVMMLMSDLLYYMIFSLVRILLPSRQPSL